MRRMILGLLVLLSGSASAQVNYVLNPDFEQHTICPQNYDEITLAKYWSGVDSLGQNSCVPDYCHTCGNINSPVTVPLGDKYFQYPRSGDGFAEVVFFCGDTTQPTMQRDYLQGRLYKRLISGKSYCVSYHVNLGEGAKYAIQEISAYFDNGIIDTTSNCGLPLTNYIPQITNLGGIITDTAKWTKIEASFISNGTEQFITIGNFKDNAHTTYVQLPLNGRNNSVIYGFYLVDDVSVVESDLKADAGPNTHVGNGDSVYIGRPKEVGLECTWNVLGNTAVIGTGAGIWVKPSVTTSYVVTQTLCGVTKKDTVVVEVWGVGVSRIHAKRGQGYTLSPNPNKGTFELTQSYPIDESVQAEILDVLGREVFGGKLQFRDGRAGIQLSGLAPGLYVVKFSDGFVKPLRFEIR